jgi:hypothetical protein
MSTLPPKSDIRLRRNVGRHGPMATFCIAENSKTIGDKSSDAGAVDRCRHRQTGGSAEEMTCGYNGCSYPAMLYVGLVLCAVTGSNVAQSLGLDANRFAIVIILLVPALIGSRLYFVLLRHFREQYFVRQSPPMGQAASCAKTCARTRTTAGTRLLCRRPHLRS